jgi:hypothetical protein
MQCEVEPKHVIYKREYTYDELYEVTRSSRSEMPSSSVSEASEEPTRDGSIEFATPLSEVAGAYTHAAYHGVD